MKQRWQQARPTEARFERRLIVLFMVIFVGASGFFAWALKPERHHISVEGLDHAVVFWSAAKDLGAALRSGGVELGPKDQVSPSLTMPLKGKREVAVQIKKALPVTVAVDGKNLQTESVAANVAGLLQELSVQLNPKDTVSFDLAAALVAGMQVKVVRHTETISVAQVEIPFETVRQEDRTMDAGRTEELQAGESGIKEIKNITYLEDGRPVKTEVVEEKVAKEPVSQVVAYGTVAVVSRGGRDYRYSRELELSATGYTAGKESNPNGNGYTYTGMKAVHGVVAVDPNVIPLYTRLYIEGYGPAVAADIGGAIKGNRIDLCFDSLAEALSWGRRTVTVYVLND
ncbi:MAG TPA: 3D domain-containing protein [Symbiobacteriaceae bacterium]